MGMQISSNVDTQIPQKESLWWSSQIFGWSVRRSGTKTRMWNNRRPSYGRSCTHADFDSIQMCAFPVVGFIKGRSAILIARQYSGRKRNFTGRHFWAKSYHDFTVGKDDEAISKYIEEQEREDRRIDQLSYFVNKSPPPLRWPTVFSRFERVTFFKPPAVPE